MDTENALNQYRTPTNAQEYYMNSYGEELSTARKSFNIAFGNLGYSQFSNKPFIFIFDDASDICKISRILRLDRADLFHEDHPGDQNLRRLFNTRWAQWFDLSAHQMTYIIPLPTNYLHDWIISKSLLICGGLELASSSYSKRRRMQYLLQTSLSGREQYRRIRRFQAFSLSSVDYES